jgi:tetratricopeptide (TPR) repeat protein
MQTGRAPLRAGSARPGRGGDSSLFRPGRVLAFVGPFLVIALVAVAVTRFVTAGSGTSAGPSDGPVDPVAALEATTQARPDDPTGWRQLGTAYVGRAVVTANPTFHELASSAFGRAEALAPGDPATASARTSLQLTLHDFDGALTGARVALDANPFDPIARLAAVDAQVELGRYDEAARDLQVLLDNKPSMPALARASYLRELHGDTEGALLAMREAEVAAAHTDPQSRATVAVYRGDILFATGRIDEALTAYDRAASLLPGHALSDLGRSRVLAARGDLTAAIAVLDELVARVPLPAAVELRADLLTLDGRDEDARASIELYGVLTRLQEASGAVVDLEAALFEADHGDPARAVSLAQRAYAERAGIHGADAVAWSLHRSGHDAEAMPFVDEALRLGTNDALLRYHGAAIAAAVGDQARARTLLTEAFAANPWFSFHLRAEATELASTLLVPVPSVWEPR